MYHHDDDKTNRDGSAFAVDKSILKKKVTKLVKPSS